MWREGFPPNYGVARDWSNTYAFAHSRCAIPFMHGCVELARLGVKGLGSHAHKSIYQLHG